MSSLKKQLRLSDSCSYEDLQKTCNRYYALYKGVLESSGEESVRAIAKSKLDDLVKQAHEEGVRLWEMGEVDFDKASANTNATVEQELARMSGTLTGVQAKKLNDMIAVLPHSAKRYYLSALVLMQSSNASADSYREAAVKLMSACSEDPANPVYQAALDSVKQEIVAYNQDLEAHLQEQQRIAEEEERAIRRDNFWAGVGAFFAGFGKVLLWIGKALLWIGGAILTFYGYLFSCLCGACGACDGC